MSMHTPEPWAIHYDAESGEWPMVMSGGNAGKIVANINPRSFCLPAKGFVEMPDLENARRIVACVNACRGLLTDDLEQKGLVAAVGTELLKLDAQLDGATRQIGVMAELLRDVRSDLSFFRAVDPERMRYTTHDNDPINRIDAVLAGKLPEPAPVVSAVDVLCLCDAIIHGGERCGGIVYDRASRLRQSAEAAMLAAIPKSNIDAK